MSGIDDQYEDDFTEMFCEDIDNGFFSEDDGFSIDESVTIDGPDDDEDY